MESTAWFQQSYVRRSPRGGRGRKSQDAIAHQIDVFGREAQPPELHVGVVTRVPVRLHYTLGGVPADASEHVADLVGEHVTHQARNGRASDRGQHAVVEQHDVSGLIGHRVSERPRMLIVWSCERDRHYDATAYETPTLRVAPVELDADA